MKKNPFVVAASTDNDNFLHSTTVSDAQALRSMKEHWIRTQLQARSKEYTQSVSVKLLAITWNVNGKLCSDNLAPIFAFDADLYFIGLQEVDMSAESILLNDSPREEYWATFFISNHLKDCTKVVSKQLGGMLLIIFAKSHLTKSISDVYVDSKGCGVMGFGNKGAVSARMRIHDSSVCIVNSHLAADSSMVERRNADYDEICRSISFPAKSTSSFSFSDPNSAGVFSVWESDILIWMGDLNYRITLPDIQVKDMIKSSLIPEILKHDQLVKEQSFAGGAFSDFEEAEITFQPSYKYDPGTSTFDTSEKKRTPSYCDRILFRKGDSVKVLKYDCALEVLTSDHKPVFGQLSLSLKQIVADKFSVVHQTVLRDLDKLENESMPDCKLSVNTLDFGTIEYLEPVHHDIVLENVGNVAAKARFIPKLDETSICKGFMWINPPMSIVMPGEKLSIRLTILVDNTNVSKLNVGDEKLDDILILHLENGKDFFISVAGVFVPTCFGMDLELLDRLPDPVLKVRNELPQLWNDVQQNRSKSIGKPSSPPKKGTLHVPKEIWRVVDYLYHFGLGVDGIFLTSGDQQMMKDIRKCLDCGKDFHMPSTLSRESLSPSSDVSEQSSQELHIMYINSMAETLLKLLEALPVPVIPFGSCYQKCLDASVNYSMAKAAISQLPTPNYNLFVYITSFLREIVETSSGKISAETLSLVFSAAILRTPKPIKSKYHDIIAKKKTDFMLLFLRPTTSTSE